MLEDRPVDGRAILRETTAMEFELTFGKGPRAPRSADATFRILVMGDFDGRSSRGLVQPLANRAPVRVDLDTIDRFLEGLRAQVQVELAGTAGATCVAFAELDDLHPDRLFEHVHEFAALRTTRRRLLDASTFASAAAEVRAWTTVPPASGGNVAAASGAPGNEDGTETLARLLGRSPSPPATPSVSASGSPVSAGTAATSGWLLELLRPLVASQVVAPPPDDRQALLATVDAAIAEGMRRLLHASPFQALESAWRGIDFLVRRIEQGEQMAIFAWNVSRAELMADASEGDDPDQSALFRALVEPAGCTPGTEPWGIVLGLYPFGVGPDDRSALARIAAVAHAAGAPFLASARPDLVRMALDEPARLTANPEWIALRSRPEAASVGLVAPRFLLRLPYGQATDPVSAFAFTELAPRPDHDAYLWGHGALALGSVLAEAFAEGGWPMRADRSFELGGLPVHVQKDGGETTMMPCAEMWMSDAQAEALFRAGIVPIQSIRGRDAVRIPRVRSLASR